jgi:hypothetical protein
MVCAVHHNKRTAISDGGLVLWRHGHAADVYKCSGDVLPVIAHAPLAFMKAWATALENPTSRSRGS